MPDHSDNSVDERERRGVSRRVVTLETKVDHLHLKLADVESEQRHVRQVLDSRYNALHEGQGIVVGKLDRLAEQLTDSKTSGAMLMQTVTSLQNASKEHDGEIATIKNMANQLAGALSLAKVLGIGSFTMMVAIFAALFVAVVKLTQLAQFLPTK